MGTYKRKLKKGWRWYFSGQYLGIKYHSKAIYHSKTECAKAERIKLQEMDRKQRFPNEMNLKDLMSNRLDYLLQNKSKDYYKENKRYFRKALAVWGDKDVDKISKADVNSLLSSEAKRLKRAGRSNQKANSMLRSLKALFNYGMKVYDLDLKNPCNLDFLPIEIKLKYIPTKDDIEAVRKMLSVEELALFDFVDETGCRINEAVRLLWSDINKDTVILRTRKSKNSNLTPRIIPRPECLKNLTNEGKVFKKWSAYPRFLEGKANWNWHNLRHRRASIWATNGMSIFEIMVRLGHQNMKTTMNYLQLLGFSHSITNGN
jgi:integrase